MIVRELKLVPPGDNAAIVELKYPARPAARAAPRRRQGRDRHVSRHPRPRARRTRARARRSRGASRDEEHQLGRGGDPRADLRALEEWARLVDVHEIQLRAREDAVERASRCCLRIGELQAHEARRRRQGVRRLRARVPRGSVDDDGAHRARAAGDDLRGVAAARRRCTRRRSRSSSPRASKRARARAAHQGRRGVRREAREAGEGGRVLPPRAGHRARRSDGARGARALLHARRALARAARGLSQEGRADGATPAAREQIYFRIAYLWEEMLGNVDEAIATYKEILGARRANVKALNALDRLYLGGKQWRELADNLTRQLQLTDDKPEKIELLVRLGGAARARARRGRRRRSTPIARCSISSATTTRRCAALERLMTLPEHELQVATILEPIYKGRGRVAEADRRVRDHGAARDRSGAQDRAAPPDRRAVRDGRRGRRGVPHLRPRAARGSGAQGDADAARAAGPHARSLEGPGRRSTTR